MKAPLTGNSITDRVVFTGLYIPDATRHAAAADGEPAQPEASDAEARDAAQGA